MKEKFDKYVGKKATISIAGITVEVEIKDFKNSYGRDRFLVSPVAGAGEIWTEKVDLKK